MPENTNYETFARSLSLALKNVTVPAWCFFAWPEILQHAIAIATKRRNMQGIRFLDSRGWHHYARTVSDAHMCLAIGMIPMRSDDTAMDVKTWDPYGGYLLDNRPLNHYFHGGHMSTEPQKPNVTVQAHPDDFQNIISGILVGLQAFQAAAPFILQIIAIEKGQPAQITVHAQQQ